MYLRSHKRLGFRAALSVVAPMLAILVVASVVVGVVSYRLANAQLEASVRNTVADDIDLIQEYLWQLDRAAVRSKLDAYVNYGRITGARIDYEDGSVVQAGTLGQDPSAYSVTYSLDYPQQAGLVHLGQLTLEATRDESWAQARNRIIAVVGITAIAVLVTILLILRSLNLLVLSPIKKIANDLRQLPENWHDFRIDLGSVSHAEELDELVRSIHEMRDHILTSQSESSRNQARLAQAAELAGLGYATSDQTTNRFLECDDNYAAMHGKTVEEMLELSIRTDLIEGMSHPEDVVSGLAFQQRLLRGESMKSTARVRVNGGNYRHIHKIFTAKKTPDGRSGVVEIVAQNLTELYETKEQLLQSQKMDAIGKLSGGVAHDFNNILAIISGNLELLRDEAKTERLTGYVETALIAVERGATLTQRMLAFARKQTLSPEVVDVAELVSGSAGLIRASIGATIDLEIRLDDIHWNAKVDRVQLEAVLLNLVVNARDAMPRGGNLIIDVKNARIDETGETDNQGLIVEEYVCIAVTDSGEGMSEETLEKACEPFFTTKEVGKGTGLGLSMAFGFAKQSGGHLRLDSKPGKGTSVRLYLPHVPTAVPAGVDPAADASPAALRDLQVFLVEDDDSLRATIASQIRSLGCDVSSAADGKSAIELARKLPNIDILLSDILLPGSLDGGKVAEEVASSFPECAILFMSGFSDTVILDKGPADQDRVILQKPFSVISLQQALTTAIAERA